ncbi:MAG: PIN domain-containing protein [Polyangiaceae bacterium]
MAEALILDSEALNALAHPGEPGVLALRTRAILQVARDRKAIVRVPAPVLAEVCRSPKLDAAIQQVLSLKGILIEPLTERVARRAGHLLARVKSSSAHAIDAFVVATALEFPSSLIATGDVDDIERLASSFSQVQLFKI